MNINRSMSVLLLACLLTLSCAGSATPQVEGQAQTEEQSEAQKAWEKYFTKCGDSYYTSYALPPEGVCQFRSLKFTTKPKQLNESDKLNNISWAGTLYSGEGSTRCYMGGRWEEWYQQTKVYLRIDLTKKDGKWSASEPYSITGSRARISKVQCSDIPK